MHDSIVKIEDIQDMAARDHAAGRPCDDRFNWHAPCLPDYIAERNRLAASAASHESHIAPTGRARIEHAQGEAA